MKKVLILTAGFGEGHNAAARNLRDALEHVSDGVKVEVLDLFESTYGSFNTLVKRAYLGMVQYTPALWGGLAVASHPHLIKSEWGKNILYLWENQESFAPLLDAWEIANRDNLFTLVGHKQLPYIANSDFYKPKHIQSWKTLLYCEKHPEAIKDCIRRNENISITFYRDNGQGVEVLAQPALTGEPRVIHIQQPLPLKAARA